jgi:hypothetical protein
VGEIISESVGGIIPERRAISAGIGKHPLAESSRQRSLSIDEVEWRAAEHRWRPAVAGS